MKTRAASRNQARSRARTTTLRRGTRPVPQRAQRPGGPSTTTRARSRSARGGGAAKLTTDHDEIRSWVEERGGHPATVKRSVKPNQRAGILRIDFPGFSGEFTLKAVSWDEWFDIFEQNRLGFLHQERTASGKPSRFNKIVCRR